MTTSKPLNILLYAMDLVGPQNACIGVAQALRSRGHKVRFFSRQQTMSKFVHHGFECLELIDDVKQSSDVVKELSKSLVDYGFFTDIEPIEKIKILSTNMKFFDEECEQAIGFEPQIRAILEKEKPDLVIIDAEVISPSLIFQKNFPWVGIFCSNPLGLFLSKDLPPFTSGLPTDPSNRLKWEEYRNKLDETVFKDLRDCQEKICRQFGYEPDPEQISRPISPYLNLYQFPEELDYHDRVKLPENCQRIDAFIREEPSKYQLPDEFKNKMKKDDKLIYVSMGSMGSINVDMMKKLVNILAGTKHYYIVSKGFLADEYKLADNMIGEAYLPQTQVLPLVDMMIMHGGNNSLTEAIYYGKPLIVMPLFYDQFDNAQRVKEKGFGIKINPFNFEAKELLDAIETIFNDQKLKERLCKASKRIQQSQSKTIACERVEEIVQRFFSKK